MQGIGALTPRAISSGWTAENLRTRLIYPNGRALRYTYDALDRLTSASGTYGNLAYGYDGLGNRSSWSDDDTTGGRSEGPWTPAPEATGLAAVRPRRGRAVVARSRIVLICRPRSLPGDG